MKASGRPIALVVLGALLWLLAVAHPWVFLQTRDAKLHAHPMPNGAMRLVVALSEARSLRDQLLDRGVVGYVSEGAIDTRTGGPLQWRYYLAQYALAPSLLDHEIGLPGEELSYEFVLAYFEHAHQLEAFLFEQSRDAIVSVAPNVALTRSRRE